MHEWEKLDSIAQRYAVPNGWIYQISEIAIDGRSSEAHIFVPDSTNKPESNKNPIVECFICDVSMGRVSGTTVYSCYHCKSKIKVLPKVEDLGEE